MLYACITLLAIPCLSINNLCLFTVMLLLVMSAVFPLGLLINLGSPTGPEIK